MCEELLALLLLGVVFQISMLLRQDPRIVSVGTGLDCCREFWIIQMFYLCRLCCFSLPSCSTLLLLWQIYWIVRSWCVWLVKVSKGSILRSLFHVLPRMRRWPPQWFYYYWAVASDFSKAPNNRMWGVTTGLSCKFSLQYPIFQGLPLRVCVIICSWYCARLKAREKRLHILSADAYRFNSRASRLFMLPGWEAHIVDSPNTDLK